MINYKKIKEKRRIKKNQLAYDSLKMQLIDYPNFEFNRYVLAFVKKFIKHGMLKIYNNYNDYTLFVQNAYYRGYVKVENEKKEITIYLSPITTNLSQHMIKIVKFDKDTITMIDKSKYEGTNLALLESTTLSIFKNTCIINELGENNLVCRITSEVDNENSHNKLESLIINNNGEALTVKNDSQKNKTLYFKAADVFLSFENTLTNTFYFPSFSKDKISIDEAKHFVNEWSKENDKIKEIIDQKKILQFSRNKE